MTIHSQRERDRLAREEEERKQEARQRNKDAMDALDKVWRDSIDHNQDVIDRTTKGMATPDIFVDVNHIEVEYD